MVVVRKRKQTMVASTTYGLCIDEPLTSTMMIVRLSIKRTSSLFLMQEVVMVIVIVTVQGVCSCLIVMVAHHTHPVNHWVTAQTMSSKTLFNCKGFWGFGVLGFWVLPLHL